MEKLILGFLPIFFLPKAVMEKRV